MVLVEWQEVMSVGVEVLDRDHRSLFAMLNEAYDALQDGTVATPLAPLLDRLVLYTHDHFAREEALMADCGYPDLVAHRGEHDQLTARVRELRERLAGDTVESLSPELLVLFKTWLTSHIRISDLQYKPYLVAWTRGQDGAAPAA